MENKRVIVFFYKVFSASILLFLILCLCGDISNQQHVIVPHLKTLQTDFFCVLRYISERDPYNSPIYGLEEKPYFPIAYLIMYPFTLFFDYRNTSEIDCLYLTIPQISAAIFLFVSLFMWIHSFMLLCKKYSTSKYIIPLSIFSSCLLFSIVRGSYVTISTACVMYFLCYYDSKSKKGTLYSISAISFASLLKVYPAIFMLMWLNKDDYKKIIQVIIVCLIAGFLPFLFFKGGFANVEYMLRNIMLQGTKFQMLVRPDRMGIISLAVQFCSFFHVQSNWLIILAKSFNYLLFLLSIVLYFMCKKNWIRLFLMACIAAVFPVSGFIYNFTLLIPVFAIIFGSSNKDISRGTLVLIVVLFYFSIVPIQLVYRGISLTQIVNNLAGVTLWLYIIAVSILDIKKTVFKKLNNC